jgi:hypothetical protein
MQATAMALIECLHELHRAEQNRASATKAADSSSSSAAVKGQVASVHRPHRALGLHH